MVSDPLSSRLDLSPQKPVKTEKGPLQEERITTYFSYKLQATILLLKNNFNKIAGIQLGYMGF